MPQIFGPRANGIARFVLWGVVAVVVVIAAVGVLVPRSGFTTGAGLAREQPVPFSHKHHVGDVGIDCRYCHNGVETSAAAVRRLGVAEERLHTEGFVEQGKPEAPPGDRLL